MQSRLSAAVVFGKALFRIFFVALVPTVASPSISVAQSNDALTLDLIRAAARGDEVRIAEVISQGADLTKALDIATGQLVAVGALPDTSGFPVTPLMAAVVCGCPAAATALLAAGVDARLDTSALLVALKLGNAQITTTLIGRQLPLSANALPLVAIFAERPSAAANALMRRLILSGVLEGRPDFGPDGIFTPFETSGFTGQQDTAVFSILDQLLSAGFAIDAPTEVGGQTARQIASTNGDVFLAEALAQRGALLPVGWTSAREKELQLVGAARNGNSEGVDQLLRQNVDLNAADGEGRHALVQALKLSNFGIVDQLLNSNADVNVFSGDEEAALVVAASRNLTELARRLLRAGARPNDFSGRGAFALRSAARNGAEETIAVLLEAGADVGLANVEGRTALHGFNMEDGGSSRALSVRHFAAIRRLVESGFPFAKKDRDGNTILASSFRNLETLSFIHTLLEVGVPVVEDDLKAAIETGNAPLVRVLLGSSNRTVTPSPELVRSATYWVRRAPDIFIALLEFGAPLPTDPASKRELIHHSAAIDDQRLLMMLIRAIGLDEETSQEAIRVALTAGRPTNVRLLLAQGINPNLQDQYGRTVLHRVIKEDARGTSLSELEDDQQNAIAALLDGGFNIEVKDADGATISSLASVKDSTRAALLSALNRAGSNASPIHIAVRNGDVEEVRRLVINPADRERLDPLGRTPLSLALQSNQWAAARLLLRSGVEYSTRPRASWQPADVEFSSRREIANAFAVRMLERRVIDIPQDRTPAAIQALLTDYTTNRQLSIPNLVWTVQIMPTARITAGTLIVQGNQRVVYDRVDAWRVDRAKHTTFGLRNLEGRSIVARGTWGDREINFGEISFTLSGELVIPKCEFTFERPTCSPGMSIKNPNVPSSLRFRTEDGYESSPTPNFEISYPNGPAATVAPGADVVIDRSLGPVTIRVQPVPSRVFELELEASNLPGDNLQDLPEERSIQNRMRLYSRILQLIDGQHAVPQSVRERVHNKTVASTIAALSAQVFQGGYHSLVLELLRQQATVVANLDLQVREVRNAVMAQAEYTPEQLDALIARIDAVMAGASALERAELSAIRTELFQMRESASRAGVAINRLREQFFSEIDINVELYQALVLEYSQYVPADALGDVLPPNTREQIAARLSRRDVVVSDAALDGSGRRVRTAFGLPEPAQ